MPPYNPVPWGRYTSPWNVPLGPYQPEQPQVPAPIAPPVNPKLSPGMNPKLTPVGGEQVTIAPAVPAPTPVMTPPAPQPPVYGPPPDPWEDYGFGPPLISPGTNAPDRWNMPTGWGGFPTQGSRRAGGGPSIRGLIRQPGYGSWGR